MSTSSFRNQIFPLPANRVWRSYTGGRLLDARSGVAAPSDTHFPEDWIGSTTRAINPNRAMENEGISHVEWNGRDILLSEIIEAEPAYFLGEAYTKRFGPSVMPLVKFLDSAVRLHFQCHPTIPFAQRHFNSNFGKAEAYHILEIRPENPNPYIHLGFQRPPSRDEMRRMVLEQDMAALEQCFDPIPVQPGDTFFVPGGLPHAIGPGVLMVEVMEPTDFVSRFEWEKPGYTLPEPARFMGRDVEFGLDMLDFTAVPIEEITSRYKTKPVLLDENRQLLLGQPLTTAFRIELLEINGTVDLVPDSFSINIILSGGVAVTVGDAQWQFAERDRFFAPAGVSSLRFQAENARILRCLPPV